MTDKIIMLESLVKPKYNSFDNNFFDGHIKPVMDYSILLAKNYAVDFSIVSASALLHDIGLALYGSENHNVSSANEASIYLAQLDFEKKSVKKIIQSIQNHNQSSDLVLSLEDEILRSADGMAHISEMQYTFYSFLLKFSYDEAKNRTREKIKLDMAEKISLPFAKKYIQEYYENAIVLLD